jgi:uncharacterized cysteine cluster protein YcgN (CxxCxxCC family)
MEQENYRLKQVKAEEEYEALCKRCGTCCGAFDGDPCEELRQDSHGKYFCSVYEKRIGMHRTISGKQFACVPIRDLMPNLSFKGCAYLPKISYSFPLAGRVKR